MCVLCVILIPLLHSFSSCLLSVSVRPFTVPGVIMDVALNMVVLFLRNYLKLGCGEAGHHQILSPSLRPASVKNKLFLRAGFSQPAPWGVSLKV